MDGIQVYSLIDWTQTPEIVLAQAANQRKAFGWTGRTLEDFAGREWCAFHMGKYHTLDYFLYVPEVGEWAKRPALVLNGCPYTVTYWGDRGESSGFPVIRHHLLWSEVPETHKVLWMLHWAQQCDADVRHYQQLLADAQKHRWSDWVEVYSATAENAATRAAYWRNMARVQAGSPYAEPVVEPTKQERDRQPVQLRLF